MDELKIIGDDIWFDGVKIGSLAPLCATAADRVRGITETARAEGYSAGWADGYDKGVADTHIAAAD